MSNVVVLREPVEPKRQTPRRKPNAALRTREHLTEREVEKLIEAARSNRNGQRDSTMILICYRHGMRPYSIRRSTIISRAVPRPPKTSQPVPRC